MERIREERVKDERREREKTGMDGMPFLCMASQSGHLPVRVHGASERV